MRVAHLRCGTDLLANLDAAGLPGPRLVWADPLCQGPLAPGPRDEWRDRRADFLTLAYEVDSAEAARRLAEEDAALDACDADEICLWFEHDLYDQMILLHLVARLGRHRRLSLVDLGAWPGVERFTGLVQVPVEALPQVFAERQTICTEQVEAAELAWAAVAGPDPTRVDRIRHDPRLEVFRHAAAALRRWLEEFPSTTDGLGRTERTALKHLAKVAPDPVPFAELFAAVAAREQRPWLGDTMLQSMLWRLALEGEPLVLRSDEGWSLTDMGRKVLDREKDRVWVNGYDGEHGGVRLTGYDLPWRWDVDARELLVI